MRDGRPVKVQTVLLSFAMLDMEMGVRSYQLPEVAPGEYQRDIPALVMVGHWALTVRSRCPPSHRSGCSSSTTPPDEIDLDTACGFAACALRPRSCLRYRDPARGFLARRVV